MCSTNLASIAQRVAALKRYTKERATQLTETTKLVLAEKLRLGIDAGRTLPQLTKDVRRIVRLEVKGFETWRAARIARTESAIAANHGNVFGYAQGGIAEVDVLDGTDDDPCAEANGQRWSLQRALQQAVQHPNCTRDFSPVVPDEDSRADAYERWCAELEPEDLGLACALSSDLIAARDDPTPWLREPDPDDDEARDAYDDADLDLDVDPDDDQSDA